MGLIIDRPILDLLNNDSDTPCRFVRTAWGYTFVPFKRTADLPPVSVPPSMLVPAANSG